MHKEWLERRAALKAQYLNNGNSTRRAAFFLRMMKAKGMDSSTSLPPIDGSEILRGNTTNSRNRIFDKGQRLSNDVYPEYETRTPEMATTIKDLVNVTEATTVTDETTTIPTISTTNSTLHTTITPPITIARNQTMDGSLTMITTEGYNLTTTTRKPRLKKFPHWGPWSVWSGCSRSCGTGVMFQQRRCIARRASKPAKRIISKDCAGLYRRYRLCNEQDCPSDERDFRHQQCARYDDHQFQGKTYQWEPYIKDDAECELNCKPVGMKYFATLNNSVIDGTSCTRPAEYYRKNYRGRAICVDGVCKAIHASGIITGSFANSGTVHCGGLICRPISGIFTKDPLPSGYVHVATIPAGASNISITELKNSMNYLALKSSDEKFIFNGDYTVSPRGTYQAGGTAFDYQRIDGLALQQNGENIEGVTEWITSTGPTIEAVSLMVLGQEINPGIKYEYLLPIYSNTESEEEFLEGLSGEVDYSGATASDETKIDLKSGDTYYDVTSRRPVERRKRKFMWKVIGYSPCSKSCGGGTQTPTIRCVREAPTRYFSPRRCAHAEKPVLNENMLRCNTQPCPAYWRLEEWGDCQCHQGEGTQEREVRCVQELATGIVIQVNSAACMEEQPPTQKRCDCPKLRRPHRHRLHAHAKAPDSIISNSTTQRRVSSSFQNDKSGVWLMSDWNQHCSADCGTGVEYRSIFCDRSTPNTDRCDLRHTPDTTRPCENDRECGNGEWFTGAWGQCSGDCFNLTKSREVLCIRNQLIIDEEECRSNEKPVSLRNCSFDEVEYCKARWHYSAWTDCSKTCDGGTQRRTVKCLELDLKANTLKESKKCRYSIREPIYRSCNTHTCQDPRVDLIQNDISPNCVDEFPNCHSVARARLCSYEYYQQSCCYSCRGADID